MERIKKLIDKNTFFPEFSPHAANNLINDLIDYKRGIDNDNYYRTLYGPQVIEKGYLTKRSFYNYIGISLLIALSCGLFLILRTDTGTFYSGRNDIFVFLYLAS